MRKDEVYEGLTKSIVELKDFCKKTTKLIKDPDALYIVWRHHLVKWARDVHKLHLAAWKSQMSPFGESWHPLKEKYKLSYLKFGKPIGHFTGLMLKTGRSFTRSVKFDHQRHRITFFENLSKLTKAKQASLIRKKLKVKGVSKKQKKALIERGIGYSTSQAKYVQHFAEKRRLVGISDRMIKAVKDHIVEGAREGIFKRVLSYYK